MTSALELLKQRKGKSIASVQEKIDKHTKSKDYVDERFWKPTADDLGAGSAVIRFLPQCVEVEGENEPFVKLIKYNFKGPGGWYIENSPLTLGDEDPVNDANKVLWATQDEAQQNVARKRTTKKRFITNILVIRDKAKPENEGKVFLYDFTPVIFGKICEAINPPAPVDSEIEDAKEPIDPFCIFDGADFKLIFDKPQNFRSYDRSTFAEPSVLFDGDEAKIEKILSQRYLLQPLVAPNQFKSYDQLQERFNQVTGRAATSPTTSVPKKEVSVVDEISSLETSNTFSEEDDDKNFIDALMNEDS